MKANQINPPSPTANHTEPKQTERKKIWQAEKDREEIVKHLLHIIVGATRLVVDFKAK